MIELVKRLLLVSFSDDLALLILVTATAVTVIRTLEESPETTSRPDVESQRGPFITSVLLLPFDEDPKAVLVLINPLWLVRR